MSSVQKIIIADDHPLFRQALSAMLNSHLTHITLLEAESINKLEQILLTETIDLLLLDLDIPGAQGFSSLIDIRITYPEMAVAIVSGIEDDETINKAMSYGAAGFIPKSTPVDAIINAIKMIFNGELWTPDNYAIADNVEIDQRLASLTPQQHKILLMFADGLLNKQIAYELGLAESTVKSHASTIFLKLGVRNRTQAVIVLNEILLSQHSFGVK
ncbi:response regulator transcription factor [Gammaproteobacteria bacterium AS21]